MNRRSGLAGRWYARVHAEEVSDTELVSRVQQGDVAAFDVLYCRYQRFVRHASARLAGNRHDGDEIASGAMLATYRAIVNGGGPTRGSVGGYLLHAVRTAARDQGRASANVQVVSGDDRAELADGRAAVPGADLDELNDVVQAALAALPPRWQELLLAVDVEGYPLGETAARMGMSPNAAAAAMVRARNGLRREMCGMQPALLSSAH